MKPNVTKENNLINGIKLLDQAAERSFKYPLDLSKNLEISDSAENLFRLTDVSSTDIPIMLFSIRQTIMKNFLDSQPNEKMIHDWFKNNVGSLLGSDFELVKRKNNPKHIPDFWLSNQVEFIPVEIKLSTFNQKSLEQLRRYMNFYGTSKGIAVARDIDCELPENITIIPYVISDLKEVLHESLTNL